MCWTIRTFTRYLRYKGYINVDLSTAVPTVRTWRMQSLPGYLSSKQVNQVLKRIDRDGPCGRRGYAILLLLARLGLRANEIVTLSLDDMDWQAGQLSVRGKGRRRAQMPLPAEVGGAIADYLRHARPTSNNSRRLFLRKLAPHIGFSTASNASFIAKTALIRAGINVPRLGSHVFRHYLPRLTMSGGGVRNRGMFEISRRRRTETAGCHPT